MRDNTLTASLFPLTVSALQHPSRSISYLA
jgi:hypothetical protein